jgi:hypothetical protein
MINYLIHFLVDDLKCINLNFIIDILNVDLYTGNELNLYFLGTVQKIIVARSESFCAKPKD